MDRGHPSDSAKHEPSRRGEERRTVTTLFCDLVGFTALSERHDPEVVNALLRRYYAAARRVVESYGGTVEKYIGDAVVAVFGVPSAHEDDPERAVRAGLRLVDEIDALPGIGGEPLEVRVGVNTGKALVDLGVDPASGKGFLTGDAVNVAARLQAAAPPMAVAVGEATHAATERVFKFEACHPVALKGKAVPVAAWIATAPLARTGAELRSFTTGFVGREEEVAALEGLLRDAETARTVRLGLIAGEPGIGKSRLLAEFARRLDERPAIVTWRQGRCLPFGSGVTFWALSEIVKACAGILESDGVARTEARLETVLPEGAERDRTRARLRPLLGLEADEASRDENFEVWSAFLEGVAAEGPAVLVVEDLHWADEGMLAFMDDLAESSAQIPLVILATARPEVLELTGSGAGFVAAAERIALGPLSGDETARLVLACLGAKALPVSLQARLLEASGGNPLFAEELVRLLQDRDLLVSSGGQTVLREGAQLPTPDSIGALIAARLDLLDPERKGLLADAAVVGRTFWAGAVVAVGGRDASEVFEGLHELVAKELVRPVRTSSMEGETEFIFVHALVRDVAYNQLTRADRAPRHAALARWLEERTGGRTEDLAEILAYHYGTALEMANACGLDDLEDELVEPTSRYLAMAGGRAAPLDANAAAQHFARAQRVADEAARPKRRWLLSRRTRRRLRRRAPLVAAAAAVIAVAAVAALAIWTFAPTKTSSTTPKTMSAAQIAAKYGSSVVRITTPPMPPSATGKKKPSPIVGSGFMATKDGLVVTSLAVVQGKGLNTPAKVTVEYALQSGEYGKVTGTVAIHDEGSGIAVIKVDPDRVPLTPLPLGTSSSLAQNDKVAALGAQRNMSIQRANGVITSLTGTAQDYYSGNAMTFGLFDDLKYPTSAGSEPLAVIGGPLFNATGRVVGVVGPFGVGDDGAWNYDGDVTQQAVAIDLATRIVTFASKGGVSFKHGKAYMGVEYTWLSWQVASTLDEHPGALVGAVTVGSPAEQAGIRAGLASATVDGVYYLGLGGDVIVSVDGLRLTKAGQMESIVTRHQAGDVIPIQLWRKGRLVTLKVKLEVMAP